MARDLFAAGLMYPYASRMVGSRHLLAETRALIARGSAPPEPARAKLMNRAIRDLKNAGLLTNTKIKGLYVHAVHEAQLARQNWIENAANLSVVGSPTFTTDRGYAGDGGSGGLTVSAAADATSHCAGFWVNNYNGSSGLLNAGGTNGFLRASSTQMVARWAGIADVTENTSGAHSVMATADAGATLRFYKNGAQVSTEGSGASSLSLGTITLLVGHSARHAFSHWGPDLTGGEIATLNAIMSAYLTPIGAA